MAAERDLIDVSVIVIVRNGAQTIGRQLKALANQLHAPPYEILVVDNGSTDGTVSIVRSWLVDVGAADHAEIVDASGAVGIPFARNIGVRAARGRVVAFCDADDAVRSGWVAAVSTLQVGIAGGRILAQKVNGEPTEGMFPDGLAQTEYLPHAGGCNMAMIRDHLLAVGGFDESMPAYGCDDLEISWRMQESGYPISYLPDAEVDFVVSSRSQAVRKTFLAGRARMAAILRHPASQGRSFPTAGSLLAAATVRTLALPYRLVLPGKWGRSRWLRQAVASYGRLAGFHTFKPPNSD